MVDPEIEPRVEVLKGKPGRTVGVTELLGALAGCPLGLEARQDAPDLIAIDAVATPIGTSVSCVFNAAPRHRLCNDVCELTDAVILFGPADVEDLVVNQV